MAELFQHGRHQPQVSTTCGKRGQCKRGKLSALGQFVGGEGEIHKCFSLPFHMLLPRIFGVTSLFEPWSHSLLPLFSFPALLSSFSYSTDSFSLVSSHRKCWLALFFLPFFFLTVVKHTCKIYHYNQVYSSELVTLFTSLHINLQQSFILQN